MDAGEADVTRWCIEYLIRFEPAEKGNFYLAALASYRMGDRESTGLACREMISRWASFADAYPEIKRRAGDDGASGPRQCGHAAGDVDMRHDPAAKDRTTHIGIAWLCRYTQDRHTVSG